VRRYDCLCSEHGIQETIASVEDAAADALMCPTCGNFAPQHFGASGLPQMRVDAAGENCRDAGRVADGTAGWNMGLGGITTELGRRPDGTKATAYRPITHHEVGSNRRLREIAKRQGLVPLSNGAYRPIGGR
jgi:hypothetical protein